MSWTPNLQNMYFLFIESSGTWHSIWAIPNGAILSGYYDRYMYYSGYAKAGCQNPANGDNPYVNCQTPVRSERAEN